MSKGWHVARQMVGLVVALCVCVVLLAGCSGRGKPIEERLRWYEDGRVVQVIEGCLAATGGVDRWDRWARTRGELVTTVYDSDGGKLLLEQELEASWGKRLGVTLVTREPGEELVERLLPDGKVTVTGEGAMSGEAQVYSTAVKLRLLGHSLSPATLLEKGLEIQYGALERKGGRLMHRLEVTGDFFGEANPYGEGLGDMLAVWVDAETERVRRVWLRYRTGAESYGYLAVVASEYEETARGLWFPTRLEMTRSDVYREDSTNRILTSEIEALDATLVEP